MQKKLKVKKKKEKKRTTTTKNELFVEGFKFTILRWPAKPVPPPYPNV